MTRPGKGSTAKAGIEPRSAALEEDALTTRPMRRCDQGSRTLSRIHSHACVTDDESTPWKGNQQTTLFRKAGSDEAGYSSFSVHGTTEIPTNERQFSTLA